jgi:hypothetical protein
MKRYERQISGKRIGSVVAVIAAFMLLLPISSDVLCVSPDNHITIEDSNAKCCASSGTSTPINPQPNSGFSGTSDCRNCVDLYITPDELSVPTASSYKAAADFPAGECIGVWSSADISPSQFESGGFKNDCDSSVFVGSPIPLRC